jgi:hypothetical protein
VRIKSLPLVTGLLFLIITSCGEKGGKYIDQGEVHYSIEYIRNSGTLPIDLKPRSLVVSFKNNKILFEILSPVGNQGIINVMNPETQIFDTYVNMLSIRYYYAGDNGEMYPGLASMEGAQVKKTDRTTIICGYNCKNAEVTFPFDRKKIYNFWYTNEIKVKNSNNSTPFKELEGVLMSFYYIMGNSEMKFEAETVYKKDISDKVFERRPKYRLVAKEDMNRIITDMVNL